LLVDNGRFQCDSVMLGLMLQALNFFGQGRNLLDTVCFVACLGFNQMALYLFAGRIRLLIGEMPPTMLEQQESSVPFPTLQLTETVL
jgi:hypothetical protein